MVTVLRLEDLGPALKRLRAAKGLTQEAVAVKFGRQVQTISRLEQPGANPKAKTLLRYLEAVGADLAALQRALADPLAREIREDDERLRTDPAYRQLVRGMLTDLGGPTPAPEIRDVLERIEDQERRIRRLEASQGAEPVSNGADHG